MKVSKIVNKIVSKVFLVLCLLSLVFTVKSQLPPFINLSQSKLYFSKDSSRFMDFYKKIDELKEGKRKQVTIVHYGGSHIQAGFWTEVLMDGWVSRIK